MGWRKHTNEFKEKVVKEYLADGKLREMARRYELNKSQILRWTDKYQQTGGFPDGRGLAKGGGRPRKVDTSQMTQEEYIAYLEMENAILKQLRSPGNSQPR